MDPGLLATCTYDCASWYAGITIFITAVDLAVGMGEGGSASGGATPAGRPKPLAASLIAFLQSERAAVRVPACSLLKPWQHGVLFQP